MVFTFITVIIAIILMILSMLFYPKIKIGKISIGTYWIITLLCAIVLLISNKANVSDIWDSFTSSAPINPIKILVLFFSMTFISIYLDELGLFEYLANKASNIAGKSQYSIFIIFYTLISFLTVFTSNDVIILTFTPFICHFCKKMKVNPIPYLISEFVAANTLSMTLIIGNPTNIYLGLSENLDFLSYFKVMGPIAILTAFCSLGILMLIFRKSLKKPVEKENVDVTLENKAMVIITSVILLTCTVMMAISNYIDLDMWIIALGFAVLLLVITLLYSIISKKWVFLGKTASRLPYELVPFLISMFVIVLALNNVGITTKVNELLGDKLNNYSYGYSALLIANMMNNIPMSIFYSSVINNSLISTYATIISSNLAAIITPLGSLAGIMWLSILKKNEIKFGFIDFVKYGAIIGGLSSTIALSMLFIFI